MSLTTFVSSTLTDAIEINDNFKHVGQGNLLPMGGSGLDNTTSVYDLGSSTYKWNNLFVNNIYADDITVSTMWILESETTLTDTASAITITGLNGDAAEEYLLYCFFYGGAGGTNCSLDFGSSSSIFGHQFIRAYGTESMANIFSSLTYMNIANISTTGYYGFSMLNIFTKSGNDRFILGQIIDGFGGDFVNAIRLFGCTWNDSTTNITEMRFLGSFRTGTSIYLYRRTG